MLKFNHSYNATVAKIRAMYGKRLMPQDYTELAARQSVADIADYLKKNTHFADVLAPVDTNTVHRGMLEDLLRRHIFEMYRKITRFEHISGQEFYNYKIIAAEIDVILNCIRHINAKSEKQITDLPIYIQDMVSFDLIEIAKIRSFEELMEFIAKTPYDDVLREIRPDENGKVDYTECEVRLRTYYLARVEKTVSAWGGETAKKLNSMILTDVDLINVINSYRMTAYFGESAEEIERNMLPFYGRLSKAKQQEIYDAPDSEEFIKRFSKTYYGRQLADLGADMNDLEYCMSMLRFRYAKLALKSSCSAPVSVYSFMYLMEVELQNLISIIEGVRYGISAKKIESLLLV